MNHIHTSRLAFAGAVAIPTLLLTKQLYGIYIRTASVPWRRITEVRSIPDSLRDSTTIKTLVNPRGHPSLDDTRFIDVELPASARNLKDEAILAALLRGFFAGWVFAPERLLLKLVGRELTSFSGINKSSCPPPIWDKSRLEGDALPVLHTLLFGGFLVAHVELETPSPGQSVSTLDVVFGSDTRQFAGVHRFALVRDDEKPGVVRVSLEHTSCNPTVDQVLKPELMIPVHNFYAMWLFREGVAEVMRRIDSETRRS